MTDGIETYFLFEILRVYHDLFLSFIIRMQKLRFEKFYSKKTGKLFAYLK